MIVPSFLSNVKDVFVLKGRGAIVSPGIPHGTNTKSILIGDSIEIRKIDGSRLLATVRGMETKNTSNSKDIGLLLDVGDAEVTIGSELWYLGRLNAKPGA